MNWTRSQRLYAPPRGVMRARLGSSSMLAALSIAAVQVATHAQAQPTAGPAPTMLLNSGSHDATNVETIVFADVVQSPGSRWTRVHFADFHLGAHSYVVLRSLRDGHWQRLDARSLPVWSNCTAIFNGDAVELELHVAPGDVGVFVSVDRVWEPKLAGDVPRPHEPGPRSICGGDDDRVPSNDPRVGRLWFCGADGNCLNNVPGGCTGWLVSNGAALTAGHCSIAVGDVLEFNVPASLPDGTPVAGSPDNSYPITWLDSENGGTGADWAVFALGANSNTNLRPHIAQGWFRMTAVVPAYDDLIRVTGFGLDNQPAGIGGLAAPCCDRDDDGICDRNCNSSSETQQTATGTYDDFSGGGTIHEYAVDTTPGNSGSPIIWEDIGWTIGIHTTGGCDSIWAGFDNEGTAFAYDVLESALNDVWPGVVYVDSEALWVNEYGRIFQPARNVANGVFGVPDGGIVYIVPAVYHAADGNVFTAGDDGKAMTLLAFVGPVTIGD